MEEEKKVEEEKEELKDDGRIHFPISGLFVIGGIIILMIVCIVLIFVFRK